MAGEPWENEQDDDIPSDDTGLDAGGTPAAEPSEAAVPDPLADALPAQDEPSETPSDAEPAQPEDPEAWRSFRATDHPGENYHALKAIAERSPHVKRAISTFASEYAREKILPDLNKAREDVRRLTNERDNVKRLLGNLIFKEAHDRRDPELGKAILGDSRLKSQYEEWVELSQATPIPEVSPVLRDAANEIDAMFERARLEGVPDAAMRDLVAWARQEIVNPARTNPYSVVNEARSAVDDWIKSVQNGGSNGQPARTAAAAAPAAAAATKPVQPVDKGTNANVGRLQPVKEPRSGSTGRALPKVKESTLDKFETDPEGYEKFLDAYGVSDSTELRKKGWVVPG